MGVPPGDAAVAAGPVAAGAASASLKLLCNQGVLIDLISF